MRTNKLFSRDNSSWLTLVKTSAPSVLCFPTPLAEADAILVVLPLNTIRVVQDGDRQLVEDEEGARRPPHLLRARHQLYAQVNSRLVQSLPFGSSFLCSGSTSPMLSSI